MTKIFCRLCLLKTDLKPDHLIDIFSETGIELNIQNILSKHFWFDINETDIYPNDICLTCWSIVKEFNSFYENVNQKYLNFTVTLENLPLESIVLPVDDDDNLQISNEDTDSDDDSIKYDKKTNNKNAEQNQKIKDFYKMECDLCNTKLETFNDVNKHFLETHNQKGYIKCCNKKLLRRNKLLNHMERHINPDNFKCQICNKIFSQIAYLNTHMDKHASDDSKMYECNKCPKKFARKSKLTLHQNCHIPKEDKNFKCLQCDKIYAVKSALIYHEKSFHLKIYEFVCDVCAKVFNTKSNFETHRRTHNDGTIAQLPKQQCHICNTWMKNLVGLKKHIKTMHENNDNEYFCDICGKQSPNKKALLSHKKYVHIDERKFECNRCSKAFKKAISLKEHIAATHTGEVLYNCAYCPKTFNSSANMHSHQKKIHTIEWTKAKLNKNVS